MNEKIYTTEKGLEINLSDFSEVDAHLRSNNLTKKDWISISKYQYLSEEFIEKYADKLDWEIISDYQKLSEEFMEKYADKLFFEDTIILIKNKNETTYVF